MIQKGEKIFNGYETTLGYCAGYYGISTILILDEPFNGLDKSGIEHIRKLLLELKKQPLYYWQAIIKKI